MAVTAAQFAKFLSGAAEITRRQETRLSDQTKGSGGFAYSETELLSIDGVQVGFAGSGESGLVHVVRPGEPPRRPEGKPFRPDRSTVGEEEWRRYLEQKERFDALWAVFMEEQKRYFEHRDLYRDIFRARDEGDGKELVVGVVHLRSQRDSEVNRPITVLDVVVELDERTGDLTVVPAGSNRNETGWLPMELRKQFREAAQQLDDLEVAEPGGLDGAMVSLAHRLGPDFSTDATAGADFLIEAEYFLAYRRQTATAISDLMERMVEAFEEGRAPTEAYRTLLEQDVSASSTGAATSSGLLPLPASSIQEEIVDHALSSPLTVVLGPPGTGKTHTIANTAAALIASGKRVLVTSERELPLLEVQDKLPKSMRPLLLPIFGRGNVTALQRSATGIQEKQTKARKPGARVQAINELVDKVERLKGEQLELQRQLFDAACADASTVRIGGTDLPLQAWMKVFRDDPETPLYVEGGLLFGDGIIDRELAEDLLRRTDALTRDHLTFSGYTFPQELSHLTTPAELRSEVSPLHETLKALGAREEPDLESLEPWAGQLEEVSAELSRCGLPPIPAEPRPRQVVLARSCREASGLLGNESGGADLLAAASIVKAGYDLTTKAFRLVRNDQTGYLERFVKEASDAGSGALRTLVDEAKQLQFRSQPIHNVVESDGDHSPIKLLRQAEALRGHLEAGGRFRTLLGVPKEVKAAADMLGSVHVDGEQVSSKYLLGLAIEHLEAEVDDFNAYRWATANGFQGPQGEVRAWVERVCNLPIDAQEVRDLLGRIFTGKSEWADEPLDIVLSNRASGLDGFLDERVEPSEHYGPKLLSQAQAQLEEALGCLPDIWEHHVSRDGLDLETLIVALRSIALVSAIDSPHLTEIGSESLGLAAGKSRRDHERRTARAELDAVNSTRRASLENLSRPSPGVEALLSAIDAEDVHAYENAWETVRVEHVLWAAGSEYHKTLASVRDQLPELTAALTSGEPDREALARDVLSDIERLQERRAGYHTVLDAFQAIPDFDELSRELQAVLLRRRRAESELAEARCWHAALERLEENPSALTGINAMQVAAQGVPKTKTAKSYPSKLQALRTAMRRALPGVPGVVMKMERCAELVGLPDTDEKKFDVVIVDEASQSLFTSLFVFGLAESVIIVGDNYQTSPRIPFGGAIGLQMTELALDAIPSHPNVNQFSADFSLFDAALSMSKPFVMTEHFRCDPQIIELSNTLCYEQNGHTLQPVKAPDPDNPMPVELHFVERASVDLEGINVEEADAVVSKVLQIIRDEPDATIGVVVVGSSPSAQVRQLNQAILEHVGPEETVRRRLEVGTAAAFQGAERDVVVISMVDAPSVEEPVLKRKPHEFTGNNRYFVQDLNVAVSRAKSQLHIFHSFSPNELKEGDVRGVLLSAANRTATEVNDAVELQKADSQFERDVFTAIRTRFPHARIRAQVPAAGYRIDLVVEQAGREVAIECDGDRWHTSTEDVMRDTQRQRLLESLGWRFIRPLASQWYSPSAGDHWLGRVEEALGSPAP